jgi:NAD(P)-dependent dehydrogenase (short-subunit alcohol dehydrogenase family)
MKYLTVKEIAKNWNVSERRVTALLNANKIVGAVKKGGIWNIPEDAQKPDDGRFSFSQNIIKKKIVIAGINSDVGTCLAKILVSENFDVIGLYQKGSTLSDSLKQIAGITFVEVDYFNRDNLISFCKSVKGNLVGFVYLEIFFKLEDTLDFDYATFEKSFQINLFAPNILTRELVGKMDANSSIVIVSSVEAMRGSFGASAYAAAQAAKVNLVQSYSNIFSELYGVRVNTLLTGWIGGYGFDDAFAKTKNKIPLKRLGFPEEIADDIFLLLTRHKYTTGSNLIADGGYLSVDEQSRSEDLENARFYRFIDKFLNECEKGDKIWAVSMLMPNEWNDDPQEKKFRQDNINAAVRGVDVERIFVFDFNSNREIKTNKSLQRYVLNKYVNSLAVDLAVLQKKDAKLLTQIDNGFFALNDDKIFVDYLADSGKSRGYITFNKQIVKTYRTAYEKLRKYAIPIAQVLKEGKSDDRK